jgi:hypothetical protein
MRDARASSWQPCGGFLTVVGLLCVGCALNPSPRQMYEGAPLPKEQVGIVRSGCVAGNGLTIMIVEIDGKDISDICADFALLPGEHQIDLSAKRLAPKLEPPVMGSGIMLGGPPSTMGTFPEQGSQVIWTAPSTLRINCTVQAGKEVMIVGTGGIGQDWDARCQERAQ